MPVPHRPKATIRGIPRVLLVFVVLLSGCDLFGSDPVPATVTVSPATLELDAIGVTRTLTVEVLDDQNRPIGNPRVTWSSSDPAVATVTEGGVLQSQGNGTAVITAAAGRATGSMTVRVSQVITNLTLLTGGGQSGPAGEALPQPIAVLARDRNGNPVRGADLRFTVEQGGGSLQPEVALSDATGRASSVWTLGTRAGDLQVARVSGVAPGSSGAITVTASAVAGPADHMVVLSGNGQAAPRGRPLPEPILVVVQDRFQNAVAGIPVAFTVESGGGSFTPSSVTSTGGGFAESSWTLGNVLGTQTGRVTAPGLSPLTLTAVGLAIPTSAVVAEGNGQIADAGTAVPLAPAVRVLDAEGAPVVGITVRFTVEAGGGSVSGGNPVTDATGLARVGAWTLGQVVGENRLRAQVEDLPALVFTAQGVPGPVSTLERLSGSGQAGPPGTLLATPLRVRARDAFGNLVPGAEIRFQVVQGGGTLSAPAAATAADGTAQVTWTLGGAGDQGARAFVEGRPARPVIFAAVAVEGALPSDFSITLRYLAPVEEAYELMTELAAARWATAIVGDLPPIEIRAPADFFCGVGEPELDEVIDDVLIFIRIAPIDGPGGVLGGAGPCAIRTAGLLTVVGVILLDSEDLATISPTLAATVILHEMGHVLGFGTLWGPQQFDLLRNPSLPNSPGVDTHFAGPRAIAAFDASGGENYPNQKVPVENTQGGQGTRDSHWREGVMLNELMTGFVTEGLNPLSRITIASLEDLGYVVNLNAADAYSLPAFGAAPAPEAGRRILDLGNDILRIPIQVVGPRGEVVRTIPRDFR